MKIYNLIKTPITYNGEEHEVHLSVNEHGAITFMTIYKVHPKRLFKARSLDSLYTIYKETLEEEMIEQGIPLTSSTKYVDAIKIAFHLYEEELRRKELNRRRKEEFTQQLEVRANKLAEWDGIIQGEEE